MSKSRVVGKTPVFFGPPLAILTDGKKNTMEISGRLNLAAERYLEILRHHGLELDEPERQCLIHICNTGFMSPLEIRELSMEVRLTGIRLRRSGQGGAGAEARCGQFRRPGRRRRIVWGFEHGKTNAMDSAFQYRQRDAG